MRRRLTPLLAAAALLATAPHARAQDTARHPGDDLTVYLVTMGQGTYVWEQFGHNTIWIRDAATRTTISYNYGIFDMAQEGFIRRFIKGRMLYRMEAFDADDELARYMADNRTVWQQRLNLTAEQKVALREFLEWNWLPQNKEYLYHYYHDNCSTRVRDALDRVLGGALYAQLFGQATGTTFRWHSLRLTGASVPVYTGLSLGLGRPTDLPIDAWAESFIPMRLMAHARNVRVAGADGSMVPLVAEERTLFEATREPEAAAPPNRWPIYLIASSAVGALLVLLARHARTRRRAAFPLAVAISIWSVVAGVFGVVLAFLWIATDHTTSYDNQNLLQVNPLSLLVSVAVPLALFGTANRAAAERRAADTSAEHATGLKGRPSRVAQFAWPAALAVLAMSVAGLLLSLVPGIGQQNGPIIALALPLHLATVLVLQRTRGARPSHREDVSARIPQDVAA